MDAVAYAGEKRDGARVAYGLRAYGQEERFSDTRTTRERSEESAVAVRLRRDERLKKTERKDPFPRAKRHDWGQRTPRPRGAAPTGDSTRGASRGGGGATKRRRPRGDRDASRARVRVARLRGRVHIVRASCRRRRVARRFGNVESARVGKANRAADGSIAAHLLPQRSAPARRGARSAEAVVRASADMLSGDECGEPRARSCACRCGHALVHGKGDGGYYRVSTRVRGLPGSQESQSRDFLGITIFGESKKLAGRLVAVRTVLVDENPLRFDGLCTFSHHASGKRHASGKDARASNNAARTLIPRIIITTFDEKNTCTPLLNTRAEVLTVRVRVLGGDARGRAVRLPVAPPA